MTLRAATDEERRELASAEGSSTLWKVICAAWFSVSIAIAAIGLLFLVTRARSIAASLFVLLVGATSAAFYVYLHRLLTRAARTAQVLAETDAGGGHVDESVFSIADAIQVAETEDEGLHFFLTVREPFTDADHERGRVPEDGDILTVDFETLRR
jgi:hypothetical protein